VPSNALHSRQIKHGEIYQIITEKQVRQCCIILNAMKKKQISSNSFFYCGFIKFLKLKESTKLKLCVFVCLNFKIDKDFEIMVDNGNFKIRIKSH